MIIRQGIDITDVRRVEQAIRRRGKRFIERIFTPSEAAYCESKRMKFEHYAARFAAKEAAMKAFEVRREHRYRFREIEIRRAPTGKPFLYLSEVSRKRFRVPEKCQMEISMSHEREFAVATVLVIVKS
jgi:holo-[acyl-carrier protein] synthase